MNTKGDLGELAVNTVTVNTMEHHQPGLISVPGRTMLYTHVLSEYLASTVYRGIFDNISGNITFVKSINKVLSNGADSKQTYAFVITMNSFTVIDVTTNNKVHFMVVHFIRVNTSFKHYCSFSIDLLN